MPDLTDAKIDKLIEESQTWAHPKCVDPLIRIIKQIRAENAALRASLKSIGDQAEECGDPANPAFFNLVSLIVDEVDKHKEAIR